MGKTFSTGLLTNGIWQDASNNIGIGAAPSGSYKLEVTGTGNFTGVLRVGAATGFAVGSIAGYRRIEYTGTTFSMLTNADGYAGLSAGTGIFSDNVLIGATSSTGAGNRRLQVTGSGAAQLLVSNTTSTGHIALYSTGVDAYITKNTGSGTMYFGLSPQDGSTFTSQMTILNNGNIGVGTSSPLSKFSIASPAGITSFPTYSTNDQASINWWYWASAAEGYTRYMDIVPKGAPDGTYGGSIIRFLTNTITNASNPIERVRIPSTGGLIVIQTVDNFGYEFRLRNAATNEWSFINGGDNVLYLGYNSAVRGTFNPNNGVYTPSSDINKKKDFELSTIGLNAVLGLKPTLYRMKEEEDTSEKHLGFIAQEVKEFIPQAYTESLIGEETFIGLTEMPIIATLVKAIQELNERLNKAGL